MHPPPASRARVSARRPRRPDEHNVRHVKLDAHQHPVSSKPLRPANRAPASPPRPRRSGEHNVRHINLDDQQHPVRRKPLRPASRPEVQHSDGTRPTNTTCRTPTSARICGRPTASPPDQPAAPKPRTCEGTGRPTKSCCTPTSPRTSAARTVSRLTQPNSAAAHLLGQEHPHSAHSRKAGPEGPRQPLRSLPARRARTGRGRPRAPFADPNAPRHRHYNEVNPPHTVKRNQVDGIES